MVYSNTYAEIRLDKIGENYKAICQKSGAPVMAVVKADAYGHGAVQVAKYLEKDCPFFGVSSASEALELRSAGIEKPILILGRVNPAVFPQLIQQEIRPAIGSLADGKLLSQAAVDCGKTARFHLAVDTGMSRIGFQVSPQDADICQEICGLPNLCPEGLFSHFATADCADLEKTRQQAARFQQFVTWLQERGITLPLCHLDNSAGIMNFGCHHQMTRAGITLYGLYPSDQVDKQLLRLQPALSWHARVACVKKLPAGREISYGGTFVTDRETTVATVTAGYADGYRRSLSGKFYVLIRGQKAPILGRICMDQFMVDVSHIPDVQVDDDVVLLGKSGELEISAEEIAQASHSFHYEQVCDLSRRVARVYLDGEQVLSTSDYLIEEG